MARKSAVWGATVALATVTISAPCPVKAEVIDFTDLGGGSGGLPNSTPGYHGFYWGNFGYGNPQPFYDTGFPQYGAYTLNGDESSFVTQSGATFTLNSLDITSAFTNNEIVYIRGYDQNHVQIYNGGTTVSVFSTTPVVLDWTGITGVAIGSYGGTDAGLHGAPGANQFNDIIIQDMTINAGAVPEPGTLALVGIAAIGGASSLRRRWKSSGARPLRCSFACGKDDR